MFETKTLDPFPPHHGNPFHHDPYHMGTRIGENCVVMYKNHSNEKVPYLIVVNTETGERLKVTLTEELP